MSLLRVYRDSGGAVLSELSDQGAMAEQLAGIGVLFEQWSATRKVTADDPDEVILAAYDESIKRLNEKYGFKSADVVALTPDHPDRVALRNKFLAEHTHTDFEVRFFVDGMGLFYLHHDDKVYALLCERGDLISVPAQTRHWFDMGSAPDFKCIRLFITPEGWVANYTGSSIADRFPALDEFVRVAA